MNDDSSRSRLIMPLSPILINYIRHEYPDTGLILISTVELTVKESRNHYHDIMRSLEPLLREKTKAFVDKLFMFRKRLCRDNVRCTSQYCLFAHDESELVASHRRMPIDSSSNKRIRINNNEVVLNKVDESKYTTEHLNKYASEFGSVSDVRRLNRGKYVIVFDDAEEAKKLVESADFVLGDSEIKKFFNVNITTVEPPKKSDLVQMLQDQEELLDKLAISFDEKLFSSLKFITKNIKNHILFNDRKAPIYTPQIAKPSQADTDIESSLYYNMFTE